MTALTTPRKLMVWGLRGLALWGLIELAISGFGEFTHEREQLDMLKAHAAAMSRLEHRATEAERSADASATELEGRRVDIGAGALTVPKGYTPDSAISEVLRDEMLRFGAQSAQVTSVVTPTGKSFYNAEVHVTWEEPMAIAPAALSSLGARRPYMDALRIDMSHEPGGSVAKGDANLRFAFKIRGQAISTADNGSLP